MSRALIIINTQADRDRATKWAQGVPVGTRIEWKEPKRTLPQNDRFWAMLTDVAVAMKPRGRDMPADLWKIVFMAAFGHEVKFIQSLDMKTVIPVGHSSSDLSVREMSDLMEFITAWAAENGVALSDPKTQDSGEVSSLSSPDQDAGVSPPFLAPASALIRYARSAMAMATTPGIKPETLEKAELVWSTEIKALSDDEREKAVSIAKITRNLFKGLVKAGTAYHACADVLGISIEQLKGE